MKRHQVELDADLADLVPAFLANRQRELEKLRSALAAKDLIAIDKIGHNLKGVAGSFGFTELAGLGRELQRASRQENGADTADKIQEIGEYLNNLDIIYR